MRAAELDYSLPEHLIARHPAAQRDDSRLLVLGDDGLEHTHFRDLARRIEPGTLLVANDTRVMPARLFGTKEGSGGSVELLLVERLEAASHDDPAEVWSAMARSSRPLRVDSTVVVDALRARVLRGADEHGLVRLRLYPLSPQSGDVAALVHRLGHMPLPPYLKREAEPGDSERYQTVFARVMGAVAAPTAGLHFNDALLSRLASRQIDLATITLHVGPGTFRPVSQEDLDDHPMHTERYLVPAATAEAIGRARRRGGRVVAVGTTVVRALESACIASPSGRLEAIEGQTDLLIQPGFRFKVVDGLITNFHLPRSTLLALVYAFGGAGRVQAAYRAAIEARYRFYSYGDAMYLPSVMADRS